MAPWGGETRSPLKDWLKLPMATMGQSVAKVVMWQWAGYMYSWETEGKGAVSQGKPTAWAITGPGTPDSTCL